MLTYVKCLSENKSHVSHLTKTGMAFGGLRGVWSNKHSLWFLFHIMLFFFFLCFIHEYVHKNTDAYKTIEYVWICIHLVGCIFLAVFCCHWKLFCANKYAVTVCSACLWCLRGISSDPPFIWTGHLPAGKGTWWQRHNYLFMFPYLRPRLYAMPNQRTGHHFMKTH